MPKKSNRAQSENGSDPLKCPACKKKIAGIPHSCRYCGINHCHNHLLPEGHNCEALEEHFKNVKGEWRKNISGLFKESSSRKEVSRNIKKEESLNKKKGHYQQRRNPARG